MVCRFCSCCVYVDETKNVKCFRFDAKSKQTSIAGEKSKQHSSKAKHASNRDGCQDRVRGHLQIQRRHTHRREIRSLRTTRAPVLRVRVMVVRMMTMMMRMDLVHRTPIRRFLFHRLPLAPLLLPALLVLLLLLLLMMEFLQIITIRLGRRRRRSDRRSRLQRHRGTQRRRRKRQNQRRRHRRRAHHQLPPLGQLSITMPLAFHRTWGRRRPSITAATTTTVLPQHRRHGAALHHAAIIRGRTRGVGMMGVMPRTLPALARLSEGTDRDQIPSAEIPDTP